MGLAGMGQCIGGEWWNKDCLKFQTLETKRQRGIKYAHQTNHQGGKPMEQKIGPIDPELKHWLDTYQSVIDDAMWRGDIEEAYTLMKLRAELVETI
uniref:Uncharacterized protein n=2 Tax=viral metagenome TaxID=1070528 RepID=A0A6H1ZLI7_9ZZZZ